MCQSGLQVAAGQPLYREVEERQAGFKYLRGSDSAELSKGCTERTLQKPPYRTPLSSGSLFSLLSLRHSPCHLSILAPTLISHVSDLFISFSFLTSHLSGLVAKNDLPIKQKDLKRWI